MEIFIYKAVYMGRFLDSMWANCSPSLSKHINSNYSSDYRYGTGTVTNPYGYMGYRDTAILTGSSSRRENQSLNNLERQLLYGKETSLV